MSTYDAWLERPCTDWPEEEEEPDPCEACDGTGRQADEDCPECEGLGFPPQQHYDPEDE
jgi:hypothetical protein